jgi:hypothetical protein
MFHGQPFGMANIAGPTDLIEASFFLFDFNLLHPGLHPRLVPHFAARRNNSAKAMANTLMKLIDSSSAQNLAMKRDRSTAPL